MAYPAMYQPRQGIIPEAPPEAPLEEAERMLRQVIPVTNSHLKRAEKATAILGIIFAIVALVAAVALALFSTVVTAPALLFMVALWTTVGAAALAAICGIANRVIHSRMHHSGNGLLNNDLLANLMQQGIRMAMQEARLA